MTSEILFLSGRLLENQGLRKSFLILLKTKIFYDVMRPNVPV